MHEEHHLKVERTARYFTLGNASKKADELWIVLHGYRTLASDFIKVFEAIGNYAFVVAPEGLSRFYTKGSGGPESPNAIGASWMTREDRLNEIADHVAYLDKLYKHSTNGIQPKKLILLGFSQGCPAVMRWVSNGNVKPDQVLLWSGDVPRDLNFEAYKAAGVKATTMVYGDNDTLLDNALYAEGETLLREHGIPNAAIRFSGGHEIPPDALTSVRKRILG